MQKVLIAAVGVTEMLYSLS